MQGVLTGITLAMMLIVILEISRFFRRLGNLSRDIDELKEKVSNIEEILNSRSK